MQELLLSAILISGLCVVSFKVGGIISTKINKV